MKKRIKYTLIVAILLTATMYGQAVPPPVPPPPPPGLPIDGGIFLLLLSGVVYGVKKLKE
ncbi:MAG: hypothetical protein JKZ00_06660 [Flavobacteriaceae bacterium]|nr:hypothetical protein [Flavobacteriaceae bacterium]